MKFFSPRHFLQTFNIEVSSWIKLPLKEKLFISVSAKLLLRWCSWKTFHKFHINVSLTRSVSFLRWTWVNWSFIKHLALNSENIITKVLFKVSLISFFFISLSKLEVTKSLWGCWSKLSDKFQSFLKCSNSSLDLKVVCTTSLKQRFPCGKNKQGNFQIILSSSQGRKKIWCAIKKPQTQKTLMMSHRLFGARKFLFRFISGYIKTTTKRITLTT